MTQEQLATLEAWLIRAQESLKDVPDERAQTARMQLENVMSALRRMVPERRSDALDGFAGRTHWRTSVTDDQIREIAQSLVIQPWGAGSRWADALDFAHALLATTAPTVERTHENKPNPDLDKECSHKFEPFKPGLCICEICYQVRPAVEKEASIPCVHVNEPKACYRVRCQLGNKCVDDDMSPRAESENRSTGICFFCSHPIDGAHEEDCPQAAATAPDRHSILYEAGEALLAAEHHEAYEVLYRMMEECRAISLAAAPPAVEKEASGDVVAYMHRWPGCAWELSFADDDGKCVAEHSKAIALIAINRECAHGAGEVCVNTSPTVGDSALEVLRTLIGFMADIELPDELRKSKELADAYATIRGTVGDSAGEPVATLHDDGYWTWKKGAPPHESNYAGWRMDVYAHPPAQTADVRGAMTDEESGS